MLFKFFGFNSQNLKNNFIVRADDDDELVDPHDTLKEECANKHCKQLLAKLEECNNRVNSKTETTETCSEELFDLLHCVDHCVAPKIFSKLK